MPNFATTLKEEIVRLARKEVKKELEGLKKASTQYRSEIAELKRRVQALEKQSAQLAKKATKPMKEPSEATPVRFSAKGLASKREKLGLSATAMGMLLGVSAQTVYNWEAGKTRPRKEQVEAIAAVRRMGKREVRAALEESRR